MTKSTQAVLARMRIDKWLWAARFYKTRSLAAQAIAAGHVKIDGHIVKAARELCCGERIEVSIADAGAGDTPLRRRASRRHWLYAD